MIVSFGYATHGAHFKDSGLLCHDGTGRFIWYRSWPVVVVVAVAGTGGSAEDIICCCGIVLAHSKLLTALLSKAKAMPPKAVRKSSDEALRDRLGASSLFSH